MSERVKDPFAPGEWVVCVEDDRPCKKGDIVRVFQNPDDHRLFRVKDNSESKGYQPYFKSHFRPATLEEIVRHLGEEREVTEESTPTNTILDRAKSIITGNRQTTNGKPERSFYKIAQRWSLTLGTTVTAQQVALMMVDLKMVRALEGVTTEGHDDHFVDMAGYVALAAELGE